MLKVYIAEKDLVDLYEGKEIQCFTDKSIIHGNIATYYATVGEIRIEKQDTRQGYIYRKYLKIQVG